MVSSFIMFVVRMGKYNYEIDLQKNIYINTICKQFTLKDMQLQ